MPWTTLRSDSVEVAVQADITRLPNKEVAFKVSKNSGGRASALFGKTVKVEEASSDAFLGRLKDVPLGGSDYLSLEWSVPGTELKGVVEPIGAAKLLEGAALPPALSATRLKEGLSDGKAADVLAGAAGTEWGGVKFAAGWNADALFIRIKAAEDVTEVQFGIDGKCGKSAFLSWADRFILYSAEADSVHGVHYKRSVGKWMAANYDASKTKAAVKVPGAAYDGSVNYESMAWGGKQSLSVTKAETSRLIKIRWYEIGMQPFEERNIGFAAFVSGKTKNAQASYPSAAKRDIPGTWGNIKLEK
jgi:hypothetical protein